VSSGEPVWPMQRGMAPASMRAEAAPIPVEAGKAAVTITVSGSVQLR